MDILSIAMQLLKSGRRGYAFLLAKELLSYSIHNYGVNGYHIPDETNMDSLFTMNFIAIPMNNDFPYKKEFNRLQVSIRLKQLDLFCAISVSDALKGGLIDYWRRTFYFKLFGKDMNYFNRYLSSAHELRPIGNSQLYKIYLVYSIGSCISILILVIEALHTIKLFV